ncbi:tetratricopeptide repeat protein [Shewanella sp. HL-SH5]|uniref:tetratricopeptide repeat protein n=1 Tax=Shewanella sp. HL-SH5 TaxID=3436241 RepID=UPI003EBC1C80
MAQSDLASPLSVQSTKDKLEDKLYRQALYFYFAGDYAAALRQISLNEQRHQLISLRSDLFEAGLQINIGLHSQAAATLLSFEQNQNNSHQRKSNDENAQQKTKSSTSPAELLLIALLQLSEQQVEQGDNQAAQQTLAKIQIVQAEYVNQYQVLNQLAYWPNAPLMSAKLAAPGKDESVSQSLSGAYIALNNSLQYMQQNEFQLAEPILSQLKNQTWLSAQQTFWQLLFNPFSSDQYDSLDSQGNVINDKRRQQQAVNDYAKLLLAQMYVMQQQYDAAFKELADFPQNSPYSESALYLFAFAAQNVGEYDTAFNLLDLVQQQYPYSHLGWQAALLSAAQVTQQQTLEQGMARYQQAEQLYLDQIADLATFKQTFLAASDVANFSLSHKKTNLIGSPQVNSDDNSLELLTPPSFTTQSMWLKKALLDAFLATDYQTVLTLDLLNANLRSQRSKSDWLKQTLALNKQRQRSVIERQQQTPYAALITQLKQQKQSVANIITAAENQQNGRAFATQLEQQWLQRIEQSQLSINKLSGQRDMSDYQQRLTKVSGVLHWQLQRNFADRLWQHQKSLQQLDQQLNALEAQSQRFNALSASQRVYSDFDSRQQMNEAEINKLTLAIKQLRLKTSDDIRQKVTVFVDQQQQQLKRLLLTTRHEMAAILEQMAQADTLPMQRAQ